MSNTQYPPSVHTTLERAFTLMEVLVAVSILMVTFLTAAYKVPALFDSFNRKNARQVFDSDMRRARAEATREGARVVIEFFNAGKSYRLGYDRFPYSNTAVRETLILTRNLPKDVTVTTTQPIIFDSRGYLITEQGEPTQTTVTLKLRDLAFMSGTIFASGLVHYG